MAEFSRAERDRHVAAGHVSRMTFAEVLPSKGLAHPCNLIAITNLLKSVGHPQLIRKSDGEEATEMKVRHGCAVFFFLLSRRL